MSYGTVQAEKMTTESGYSLGAGNASSFKNRIINGAMQIDQRRAGASATINDANNNYVLDRWFASGQSTDGVFTVQQNAGGLTGTNLPTGFRNYLGMTVTTADASVGASQIYMLTQAIEGYNTADLMWGTTNAQTVTLSFWVRSSVTGTFSGAINNEGNTRSYAYTYTISSANTWEYKTITIPGDTTGTWETTTNRGITIRFPIGMGSTQLTTAGSWVSGTFYGATGQTQLISTLNATFYLTGVQLEVGTTATSFDTRSIGTELVLCERYFQKTYALETARGTATGAGSYSVRNQDSTSVRSTFAVPLSWKVDMRASPTLTLYTINGASGSVSIDSSPASQSSTSTVTNVYGTGSKGIAGFDVNAGVGALSFFNFQYTAESEL